MGWLSDEILFYGGIGMMAGSLLIAIICVCILQIKKVRLNVQLDAEYGEKDM